MTQSKTKLIVGSRGSDLALTQSKQTLALLQEAHPDLEIELKIIKTSGDLDQKTKLHAFAGMGVFVKELQMALLSKEIDCAIHSLKDVPEEEPAGLMLCCFPEREDARDVFVSKGLKFRDLPKGAKIGTGSPRRVLQLKALRPDLTFQDLRGNVETRIRKVTEGELDGVILAAAGLNRLGINGSNKEVTIHSISFSDMIPAIGQAALALECREEDEETQEILSVLRDEITTEAVTLERQFMKAVGGGCKIPMAAHAYPYGDGLRFMAMLGDPQTGNIARVEQNGSMDDLDFLLEDVTWKILEECKEKNIPIPKDLPPHHLLKGEA